MLQIGHRRHHRLFAVDLVAAPKSAGARQRSGLARPPSPAAAVRPAGGFAVRASAAAVACECGARLRHRRGRSHAGRLQCVREGPGRRAGRLQCRGSRALRREVTPEMLSYFSEDLATNASKGVVNRVSDVKLLQGDLAEAWREGDADYATVAMRYSLKDEMVDRESGRVVEKRRGRGHGNLDFHARTWRCTGWCRRSSRRDQRSDRHKREWPGSSRPFSFALRARRRALSPHVGFSASRSRPRSASG